MDEITVPVKGKKKVLILTADAGFGHRSAAKAIVSALEEKYDRCCEVHLVNPLNDRRTPAFLRDSQTDYDRIITHIPKIYQLGYEALDAPLPTAILDSANTVLLYEVIRDILQQYQPDAIITTYPIYQAPLSAIFAIERFSIPLLTVITDLVSVHHIWFNKAADLVTVATPILHSLAVESGISADKIRITGIPVHPNIAKETRSKADIRKALGWDPDLPTFLAVGSRRVERLTDALNILNHFGKPLQIAAVAGNDADLFNQLNSMDWHVPAHLYEFSEEIPAMMRASDAIICKAGGLITTEALASGLPLMLVDFISGQETGNVDYVVQNQAGDLVQTPMEILELVSHWMQDDGALLKARAGNACRIGRPQAAYEIADLTWSAIKSGTKTRRKRTATKKKATGPLSLLQLPSKEE
jgi:1,2-diacylglycerol 3-beta-galactosyltransferase